MHSTWVSAVSIAIVFGATQLSAQQGVVPPDTLLRNIEARGRALAAYDQVAWHGSDAILPLNPDAELITHYVAHLGNEGRWSLVLGRFNADTSAFLIAYEAHAEQGAPEFNAQPVSPARADTAYFLRAARALSTSRTDLGEPSRPYNMAVLPAPDGTWWTYHYPAMTQAGVWPHGGDVRYRLSADGRRILEKRRLHNAILEYGIAPDAESGYHTAILDDIIEDTDVFLVLARRPSVPEVIISQSYMFRIAADGRITCVIRDDTT